ncbi:MAG: hypothetical protein Q4E41_03345 [Bacteroidales bacterium]|nr:hypothetical protein [Bacteroidales bacterium]
MASFLTCDVNATWITIDNFIYDVAGDTAIVYSGKSCSGASFNLGWRDITLYVPIGSKDAYASANQWRFFNPIIEMDFSIKGDIDGDESVGVSDVTALISMILAQ